MGLLLLGGLLAAACGGTPKDEADADSTGAGGAGGAGGSWQAGCEARSGEGARRVSGELVEDTIWSGSVYLDGAVTVRGAKLTLAAGTQVVAAAGSGLIVSDEGTLEVAGTSSKPVRFCGEVDEAGSWEGVRVLEGATSKSRLTYTLLAEGGGADAALVLEEAALLEQVRVERSGADGVWAAAFAKGSEGLTVHDASGSAVVLTDARAVTPLPRGGELTGNGEDVIELAFEEIAVDATFHELGVPYLQRGEVEIVSGHTRFEAGLVYRFEEEGALRAGRGEEEVLFDVDGTEEAPVTFEGSEPTPGWWRQIVLGERVGVASKLSHGLVRHAGHWASSLEIQAAVTVDDFTLDESASGMRIGASGLGPASKGLRVRGVESAGPIEVAPDAVFTLPADTVVEDNLYDMISLLEGVLSVSGTLKDLGVPYGIAAAGFPALDVLEIGSGVSLTLPAGTSFDLGRKSLIVHGELKCRGTASQPVKLASALVPSAPFGAVVVSADAEPTTEFTYTEFSNGQTCLELHRPVEVSNSSFGACSGFAIRANTSSHAEVEYSELIQNVTYLAGNGSNLSFESF